MSNSLIRVALMALLTITLPSWASDFPSSENPAKGKWTRMKPTSFPVDLMSVLAQCNRAAKVSDSDRLTTEMCQKLPALIQGGKCQTVQVPDGVTFDYMNGHESGMSRVTRNVEKALGRTDRALVCDLGNRTFAYWFTGVKNQSCNNVGVVFTTTPKAPAPVNGVCGSNAMRYGYTTTNWPAGGNFCVVGEQSSPSLLFPQPGSSEKWSCLGQNGGQAASCEASRDAAPPPPAPAPKAEASPPQQQCGWVSQRYIVPSQGQFIHIPGLTVAVCRGQVAIPDNFVNIPGDVMTVTRQVWVCQSTNFSN